MQFVGENEMTLNAETVKSALEYWLNQRRIVDELRISSVKQLRSGALRIKFMSEKEMARRMGGRASATVHVKAGPAKDVPNADSGSAGAQQASVA